MSAPDDYGDAAEWQTPRADLEYDTWQAALRDLSDADRAYRAAFQNLTSRGALGPSSFVVLASTVDRLREVVERLGDADTLLDDSPTSAQSHHGGHD